MQLTSANGQASNIQVAPSAQVSQSNVVTNNVAITPTVTPPVTATATPVPTLGDAVVSLLSLLVLTLALGTLRRSEAAILFRKTNP